MANEAQSRGGQARAKKLSPERRKEIASAAAKSRWAKSKAIEPAAAFSEVLDSAIAAAQKINHKWTKQQALHFVYSDWLKRVQT